MKEYEKPIIEEEIIELEDSIANSGLGKKVVEDYEEESGDETLYSW